jgi:hypothetical protein
MPRGKKGRKKSAGLGTTPAGTTGARSAEMSRDKIGYAVLSFFGGAMIASALNNTGAGKFSGLAGIVAGGVGAWKKNLYAASFGAGMFFSTVSLPKPAAEGTSGVEDGEVMGFDFKTIAENTKGYFQNLGNKLMLKAPEQATVTQPETTSGLNGEDQVKYFLNPESRNELDLSALNNIEEQMEQTENNVELDSEERNF